MNEETVNRGTSRLAALGDRRHDQVAHPDEVTREVGRRQSALGRDDPDEVSARRAERRVEQLIQRGELARGLEHRTSMAHDATCVN